VWGRRFDSSFDSSFHSSLTPVLTQVWLQFWLHARAASSGDGRNNCSSISGIGSSISGIGCMLIHSAQNSTTPLAASSGAATSVSPRWRNVDFIARKYDRGKQISSSLLLSRQHDFASQLKSAELFSLFFLFFLSNYFTSVCASSQQFTLHSCVQPSPLHCTILSSL